MTVADQTQMAAEGYDVVYGARPLKRIFTKRIEAQLAKMIIAEQLKNQEQLQLIIEVKNLTSINPKCLSKKSNLI